MDGNTHSKHANASNYTGKSEYNGQKEHNGIEQKNVYPRLISTQLFNKVQNKLNERKQRA